MGRRALLTPERRQAVVDEIIATGRQDHAARHAGLSPATHYSWLDRGRRAQAKARTGHPPAQRELPYVEYLDAVESARRRYEGEILAAIREVATVGVPYETTRTVEKVGKDAKGEDVVLERTTTTTTGARRDWKAGVRLLQWSRPSEYRDLPVSPGLEPEEEARLISKAVEGALAELGVKITPEAREVVGRHLSLVADEAEAQVAS